MNKHIRFNKKTVTMDRKLFYSMQHICKAAIEEMNLEEEYHGLVFNKEFTSMCMFLGDINNVKDALNL